MAGFLYVRKAPGTHASSVRRQYEAALATFAAKRVTPGPTIDGDDFTLFLFQKRYTKAKQLVQFAGGDFVAATGTLFYKGKMGEPALRALYEDYGCADLYAGLAGQFGVVLRKRGKLACFNDYFGVYHLYATGEVVSTSLLAAAATLRERRLSRQGLHEYLFDAAIHGDGTLFEGIRRLGVNRGPRHAPIPETFDDQVDAAIADLLAYFEMLRANFGEEVQLGLSGGYGSRLLLAAALKARLRPRLFVGGAAGTTDVRIACAIAEGERIAIEHLDSAALEAPPADRFPALVEEKLAYYDGIGVRGAIHDGEEYHWRQRRMARTPLELNSGASAFAGPTCKEMNLLGHGLFPFAEPRLAHAGGPFQAEMIRRLSPRLAAYPSSSVKPLSVIFLAYRLLRKKKRQHNSAPYCYSEKYLRTVVDLNKLAIADYVDPQAMRAIEDPHFMSRVLTVELLLTTSWSDAAALPRAA